MTSNRSPAAPVLDHLLLAVDDLERSVREFRAAGFDVHPGGRYEHDTILAATVACRDGVDIELVAFGSRRLSIGVGLLARTPAWPLLGARMSILHRRIGTALVRSHGLFDIALRVDDLDTRVTRLRAAGFAFADPIELQSSPPDGSTRHRRISAADDPAVPLLVEESTPTTDSETAPSAARIDRIVVATTDIETCTRAYRALLGDPASEATWRLGETTLRIETASAPRLTACVGAPRLPPRAQTMGMSRTSAAADSAAVERLATALRLPTVSCADRDEPTDEPFDQLAELIESSYPRVHAALDLETFGHGRLYRWPGREPQRVSALLLAHMDVVPVDDPQRWTHPPFAGVVDDDFVWGRGAIDDKSRVMAILEAVESALAAGHRPHGTVYLAFGHDEEIDGEHGAHAIAEHLRAQGVQAEMSIDEGGVITQGMVDGIDRPVASIMLGEKGVATIELTTTDPGGHSSMPAKQTAVGRLARAVARIQDNPMPLRITPPVLETVRRLATHMPEPRRTLLRAVDRLEPLLARVVAARPQTAAMVRTTTAPTVIAGGVRANVLPQQARALINFRILPGDSVADVLEHCRRVTDDVGVAADITGMRAEPSPISPSSGPAFDLISATVREILPDAVVTTGIVPAATDSRHYNEVVRTRYNFAPVVFTQDDLDRIHGTDERISRENYGRLIEFNRRLIEKL